MTEATAASGYMLDDTKRAASELYDLLYVGPSDTQHMPPRAPAAAKRLIQARAKHLRSMGYEVEFSAGKRVAREGGEYIHHYLAHINIEAPNGVVWPPPMPWLEPTAEITAVAYSHETVTRTTIGRAAGSTRLVARYATRRPAAHEVAPWLAKENPSQRHRRRNRRIHP